MLNTVYRLVAPRRFEVAFNDIDLNSDKVVVRPTHLSICHADQRYYQGTRPADVMAKKLPMALIHEAIGDVVYDATGEFKPGELVVMIPNTPVEKDDVIAIFFCIVFSSCTVSFSRLNSRKSASFIISFGAIFSVQRQ
jgi:ribitol-5-phosphate 2-dehydrogenase (NADP+)